MKSDSIHDRTHRRLLWTVVCRPWTALRADTRGKADGAGSASRGGWSAEWWMARWVPVDERCPGDIRPSPPRSQATSHPTDRQAISSVSGEPMYERRIGRAFTTEIRLVEHSGVVPVAEILHRCVPVRDL